MADTLRNTIGKGDPLRFIQPYMSTYRDTKNNNLWRQENFPGGEKWVLLDSPGTGGLNSIVGGINISIDNTDPSNPVINGDINDIDDLYNVAISSPQSSDIIMFDGTDWINHSIDSLVVIGRSIFVSKAGLTIAQGAVRESMVLHFIDLAEALSVAQTGDTIYVYGGSYTVTTNIHKQGVTWNFIGNPTIKFIGNGGWSDDGIASEINIYGNVNIDTRIFESFIKITNNNTKCNINFNKVVSTSTDSSITLSAGNGILNISESLITNIRGKSIIFQGNSNYIVTIGKIVNNSSSGFGFSVFMESYDGDSILNVGSIEHGVSNIFPCVHSHNIAQTGKLTINISKKMYSLNTSTYSFWKKLIFHLSGELIINGEIDGGTTCAYSKSYAGWHPSYFEHNGYAYNDGQYALIENTQSGVNESLFNGIYVSENIDVFKLSGSNKVVVNGSVTNLNSTSVDKTGIRLTSTVNLILNSVKIFFQSVDATSFGLFGTNASNVKIIHGVSSNADVNPNITNLITGTNYVYDTDVE